MPYVLSERPADSLQSKYGYIWRGIDRVRDREFGIAGGEVIVLDLQTKEVLAFKRVFRRTGNVRGRTNVFWMTAQNCSTEAARPAGAFLYDVLKPVPEK